MDKNYYNKLVDEMNIYCDAYYNHSQSLISDYEYDMKLKELEKIEREHPEFAREDSPTNHVGSDIDSNNTIVHDVPMLSLQNGYDGEDILTFFANNSEALNMPNIEYIMEPKIDGISCSLEYKFGKLYRASTRGDGKTGENITHVAQCIESIPKKIPNALNIEVRGEIFMPYKVFLDINKEIEKSNLEPYKHPRNLASGTCKLLDANEIKRRKLSFIAYQIITPLADVKTQSDVLNKLDSLGFMANARYDGIYSSSVTIDRLMSCFDDMRQCATEYSIPTDGIVLKVNNLDYQKKLSYVGKYPKWGLAYKFPPKAEETRLMNVITQVGRTGKLTPVAVFEPINLDGSTVQYATLHNYKFIEDKDIRVGDIIKVVKAAEVIPYVEGIVKEARTGYETIIEKPTICPVCNTKTIIDGTTVTCPNEACVGRLKAILNMIVSKDCLDISGLGESILNILVDNDIITSPKDIYQLSKISNDTIDSLNISRKVWDKIKDSYAISKMKTPFSKIITSLNIPNVSQGMSRLLSKTYNNLDNLINANYDNLTQISGIGNTIANSILNYFHNGNNKDILDTIKKEGYIIKDNSRNTYNQYITGKVICVTGGVDGYTRDQIRNIIEDCGGKMASSVTGKVNMLVLGNDGSPNKVNKAKELQIEIVPGDAFVELLKESTIVESIKAEK